jgi:hypothetical protein
MVQRLSRSLIAIVLLLVAHSAVCQEPSKPDPETIAAFQLFHQGKVRQAAAKIRVIIERMPNPVARVPLQRDLLEVCATAFDWNCVEDTLNKAVPLLKSEPKLQILFPDLLLYETRLLLWNGNYDDVADIIKRGGASTASPVPHASLHSELALTLHGYHLKKLEASTAEQLRSSAILGLLLTDPKNSFSIAKVLVELIEGCSRPTTSQAHSPWLRMPKDIWVRPSTTAAPCMRATGTWSRTSCHLRTHTPPPSRISGRHPSYSNSWMLMTGLRNTASPSPMTSGWPLLFLTTSWMTRRRCMPGIHCRSRRTPSWSAAPFRDMQISSLGSRMSS